jgi:hypothetical protein
MLKDCRSILLTSTRRGCDRHEHNQSKSEQGGHRFAQASPPKQLEPTGLIQSEWSLGSHSGLATPEPI